MTQWGLDTLFNPAKRHMDEEKRRLQSTREEVGDNSGGKRIDLESGKVVIKKADDADEDTPAATATTKPDAKSGTKVDRKADAKSDSKAESKADRKDRPAPSAAAIRAAQRRGRTAR